MKEYKYDENISIPEELTECVRRGVNDAKRPNCYCRNKFKVIISLMLVCMISVGVNPRARAFTVELPIVRDVLQWFKSDPKVAHLKMYDDRTFKGEAKKDGYTLFIEDVYLAEDAIGLTFAVEDSNGEALLGYDWSISSNIGYKFERDKKCIDKKKSYPWNHVNSRGIDNEVYYNGNFACEYAYPIDYKDNLCLNFVIWRENKTIAFNDIVIEIDSDDIYATKESELNKEIQCNGNKINIEQLKVDPVGMILNYSFEVKEKTSKFSDFSKFNIISLIDQNGIEYKCNRSMVNNRDFIESKNTKCTVTSYFDQSMYFEDNINIEKIRVVTEEMPDIKSIKKDIKLDYGEEVEFILGEDKYIIEKSYSTIKMDIHSQSPRKKVFIRCENGEWLDLGYNEDTEYIYSDIILGEVEMILKMTIDEVLSLDGEKYDAAVKEFIKRYDYYNKGYDDKPLDDNIRKTVREALIQLKKNGRILEYKSKGKEEKGKEEKGKEEKGKEEKDNIYKYKMYSRRVKQPIEIGVIDYSDIKVEKHIIDLE